MNRIRLIAKAGIVAGAGALAVAFITPGGVGADFFDAATAEASIQVGNFGCTFTAPGSTVTFTPADSADPQSPVTATFQLATIESSAPGTDTVPVTVTNSGDMPVTMSWTAAISPSVSTPSATPLTAKFTDVDPSALLGLMPGGNVFLPSNGSNQTLNIGFNWTELDNHDLGTAGTVTYTFTCTDALPQPGAFKLSHPANGLSYWDGQSLILKGVSGVNAGGTALLLSPPTYIPQFEPQVILQTPAVPALSRVYFGVELTNQSPNASSSGGARTTASFVKTPNGSGWALANAPAKSWTWDEIRQYALDNNSVVAGVRVVVRDTNFTGVFTCFQYDGTVYFGSGCEAP